MKTILPIGEVRRAEYTTAASRVTRHGMVAHAHVARRRAFAHILVAATYAADIFDIFGAA